METKPVYFELPHPYRFTDIIESLNNLNAQFPNMHVHSLYNGPESPTPEDVGTIRFVRKGLLIK